MKLQDWRRREDDIKSYVIVFVLVVVFLIGPFLSGPLPQDGMAWLLVLLFPGSFIAQIGYAIKERDHEYLVVRVKQDVSLKVVENVLIEKKIPHSIHRNGFILQEHDLDIEIGRSKVNLKMLIVKGEKSYISIGPVNDQNEPLLSSLKQKIEDGFQLTGLA